MSDKPTTSAAWFAAMGMATEEIEVAGLGRLRPITTEEYLDLTQVLHPTDPNKVAFHTRGQIAYQINGQYYVRTT